MWYEINVSQHGKHLFATHERSVRDPDKAKQIADLFRARFPEAEGFKIAVTLWQQTGQSVDI